MPGIRAVLRPWLKALWLGLALLLGGWAQAQAPVLAVPPLQAHVTDLSGTLTELQVQALQAQLDGFERQYGAQIAVLLVASTAPEDIADFTQRVGEAWKLGRAGVGDGLLLVVAVQDRRVRIAPNKTLEGAIPDVVAKRIIDEQIVPAFRQGDYAGGLRNALLQLQSRISGEALPAVSGQRSSSGDDELDLAHGAMLLLVAVPVIAGVLRQLLGPKLGSLASAGAAGFLVWHLTHVLWLAMLAGLIGFFGGLMGRGLPQSAARRRRHWGRQPTDTDTSGGWGGVSWGGGGGSSGSMGGMTSGGGGDAGGGGASGSW